MTDRCSIIICTRNRPKELLATINSLVKAVKECSGLFELILIDDGDLPDPIVKDIGNTLEGVSVEFKYVKQPSSTGLFAGRIKGLRLASHDIILFIDDDVELDRYYLRKLFETYRVHPGAAGVGGIDALIRPAPWWRWLWEAVIFYRSLKKDRLSLSGFGGSMDQWGKATSPFKSEFLSGCNMSFHRKALENIDQKDWLRGYSLGEDLYLSFVARQSGDLIINPYMLVKHHRSLSSRDSATNVGYCQIVNHYKLLVEYNAQWYRYLALLVTATGLIVLYIVRAIIGRSAGWERVNGAVRGLLYVCRQIFGDFIANVRFHS